MFFKQAAEIKRVVITDNDGGFRNVAGRRNQQILSVGNPQIQNILHGSDSAVLSEIADKPAGAHVAGGGIIFNTDVLIIVIIKMTDCQFHLILNAYIEPFSIC